MKQQRHKYDHINIIYWLRLIGSGIRTPFIREMKSTSCTGFFCGPTDRQKLESIKKLDIGSMCVWHRQTRTERCVVPHKVRHLVTLGGPWHGLYGGYRHCWKHDSVWFRWSNVFTLGGCGSEYIHIMPLNKCKKLVLLLLWFLCPGRNSAFCL